jgi:hypothetical protein
MSGILLLLTWACSASDGPSYERDAGAFGVTDGPGETSDSDDTGTIEDTGNVEDSGPAAR